MSKDVWLFLVGMWAGILICWFLVVVRDAIRMARADAEKELRRKWEKKQ